MSKVWLLTLALSQRVRHGLAGGGLALLLAPGAVQAATAPAITIQPAPATVTAGQRATFSVGVTGTTPITYQWRKDGIDISGATGTTYTTPVTTTALSGSKYQVYLRNSAGAITSKSALLTVNAATGTVPAIASQPASASVIAGQTATFSVTATGTGPLAYQWLRGGTAISGATASAYTTPAATAADNGATFQVTVTNSYGAITSSAASLAVTVPVTLTTQPASLTVASGQPASFSVAATGTAPITYQWTKAGVPIAGATGATFTLGSATTADAGSYAVTVGNPAGTVTSATAVLTVGNTFAIVTQPQTQTVTPPDAVTFTVVASGSNLSYAWKLNGTAIPGATSASYTVASTEFATNGNSYTVTVSNGSSSLTSNAVSAIAQVTRVTYAGDPLPVPARPVTVLPSYTYNASYPNGAFRLGYDETLKNPVWSCYVDFPVNSPYPNSTGDYKADPRLEAPRVGKTDYNGLYTADLQGYDRGHMAMRSDVSYRYNATAGDDATIMSNLVPQISQLNQQAWQKLEYTVGGTGGGTTDGLTSFLKRVWVYTGSVFPANPTWWTSTVQTNLKIAIPVACWKVLVYEPTAGAPKVVAVLMPNIYGLPNTAAATTPYVTSVKRIEELTGLDLFPNLAAAAPGMDAAAIAAWKANVDVRGWRAPFEQATGPNVHVIQPSYDVTVSRNSYVTFQGAATSGTSTIASATWNFGDASATATGMSATHAYATAGTYTMSFKVQDALGTSNTITRVIKVN